jgi:CheY-like chemotaxis protein
MSLILAVEPDRRQAKQLSSLVRQHVRGELVVADSGAAALKALGDRIPDLILTPALLPPKDEAVLTGWLRDMGDAAAHVQTLAIPILAEPAARGKEPAGSSSIFGRMREHHVDTPGCDPKVFADQVKVYLDRAGVERSAREAQDAEVSNVVPMTTPAATPSPKPEVMASPEESAADVEEFDDAMTFEDLVFDPPPASEPGPSPAPVPEPPAAMKGPRPVARAEKRVDPAVLRSWETELGLESTTVATAPPLWRITTEAASDAPGPRATSFDAGFDAADARYAPLFRRLDELAAQHV